MFKKSIVLAMGFAFSLSLMSFVELEKDKGYKCHIQACSGLEMAESIYELEPGEDEQIYNDYYEMCMEK